MDSVTGAHISQWFDRWQGVIFVLMLQCATVGIGLVGIPVLVSWLDRHKEPTFTVVVRDPAGEVVEDMAVSPAEAEAIRARLHAGSAPAR